ncbi:hypothetical protein SAZ11_35570 [Streptomyces sp. FXJ1.4098]|uniref:hypothetical protein n=1 Tax=Streptomyces sp. NPDC020845 TaxID=3365096 RepID=UPI002996BE68|nr:hypothetical protein [Streptomyces sp. FXJ1.4098]
MLVTAALTLTACSGGSSGSSHSSRSHAAKKANKKKYGKKKYGKKIKNGGGNGSGGCSTSANGRKVIWVNNVEGAMNNIIAKNAKRQCTTSSHQGKAYRAVGALHTYSVASGGAKVTIISKKDSTQRALTAQNGGIAHIKTCADPTGKQYDGGQSKVDASDCWGRNFYEITVDGNGKITEMTEIYAS